MATTLYRPDLGRVGGEMAEALAWLNSPATIAAEIARREATGVQLANRRAVQRGQAKLVGGDKQGALPRS